jgi:acyl-CoA thioester hydrolase
LSGHRFAMRVYYEDTDAGGIVYHANYLRFAERARTEALRQAGIPHALLVEAFNRMFVVRRAEVDYALPARLDEELVVVTTPVRIGGASVDLRQDVQGLDGVSRAMLAIRLACVTVNGTRPARLPPLWRNGLTAMLEVPTRD